jgi:hypothetical protein
MTTLTRSTLATSFALSLLSGGCFFLGDQSKHQFIEADDVRLDVPGAVSDRDVDTTMIHGDLHDAALWVSQDVNTWITTLVETSGHVVNYLDGVPETSRDGNTRVYGPYADRDGRDLSWLVKIGEDGRHDHVRDVHIGPRSAKSQADMDRLMSGTLVIGEGTRSGGFDIDFDVVEKYKEIKGQGRAVHVLGGARLRDVRARDRQPEEAHRHRLRRLHGGVRRVPRRDTFFSDDTYTLPPPRPTARARSTCRSSASGTTSTGAVRSRRRWTSSGLDARRATAARAEPSSRSTARAT